MFSNSCLLIIDFQDFFTDERSQGRVEGAASVKPKLEEMIKFFLEAGHAVMATHHFNPPGEDDPFFRFYGKVIDRESPGFRVSPPVSGFEDIEVFEKSSYSVFSSSGFAERLRRLNVKNLFLAGGLAEKCVLATAFDAFQNGFNVFVVKDCLFSRYPALSGVAVEMIEKACGKSLSSKELLENSR